MTCCSRNARPFDSSGQTCSLLLVPCAAEGDAFSKAQLAVGRVTSVSDHPSELLAMQSCTLSSLQCSSADSARCYKHGALALLHYLWLPMCPKKALVLPIRHCTAIQLQLITSASTNLHCLAQAAARSCGSARSTSAAARSGRQAPLLLPCNRLRLARDNGGGQGCCHGLQRLVTCVSHLLLPHVQFALALPTSPHCRATPPPTAHSPLPHPQAGGGGPAAAHQPGGADGAAGGAGAQPQASQAGGRAQRSNDPGGRPHAGEGLPALPVCDTDSLISLDLAS